MSGLAWIFTKLVWPFLWPLFLLVSRFSPKLKKRWAFEKEFTYIPFTSPATMAFEVSSEGELEQVLPLIFDLLERKEKVEIFYCSESVDKRCLRLEQEYQGQLKVFRLALLSYLAWGSQRLERLMTAPKLVFCRYDFFPHLLCLPGKSKILVSASIKGKKNANSFWWKSLYSGFDVIVAASSQDLNFFKRSFPDKKNNLALCDYRIVQIEKRLEQRDQKLKQVSILQSFLEYLSPFSDKPKIILGSFWPNEAQLLQNSEFKKAIASKDVLLVIIPHDLRQENIDQVKSLIPETVVLTSDSKGDELPHKKGAPILISLKGVLCELYSYMDFAFVGGGHGRSIHSVLEPFVGGCSVFCGPRTFRSTEFDYVIGESVERISVVDELSSFYEIFSHKKNYRNIRDTNSLSEMRNSRVKAFFDLVEGVNHD